MAPEAWENLRVDQQSDIYSLGATLYTLLAGRPPFTGNNAGELYWAHVHEAPIPPSWRRSDAMPPALDALVLRCLAKRPEDRPASMAELRIALEDIQRAEGGVPLPTRPRLARGSEPPEA